MREIQVIDAEMLRVKLARAPADSEPFNAPIRAALVEYDELKAKGVFPVLYIDRGRLVVATTERLAEGVAEPKA